MPERGFLQCLVAAIVVIVGYEFGGLIGDHISTVGHRTVKELFGVTGLFVLKSTDYWLGTACAATALYYLVLYVDGDWR